MGNKRNLNGLIYSERKGVMKLIQGDKVVRQIIYNRQEFRIKTYRQWMQDIKNLKGIFAVVIVPDI